MEHSEFWSQRSVLQPKRNRLLLGDLPEVWVGPPHTQVTTPEAPLRAQITSGLLHPPDYKLTCVARWITVYDTSTKDPMLPQNLVTHWDSVLSLPSLGLARTSTSVASMPPQYLGLTPSKGSAQTLLFLLVCSIEWHHRSRTSVSGSYQSAFPACSSPGDLLWRDSRVDHIHNPGL